MKSSIQTVLRQRQYVPDMGFPEAIVRRTRLRVSVDFFCACFDFCGFFCLHSLANSLPISSSQVAALPLGLYDRCAGQGCIDSSPSLCSSLAVHLLQRVRASSLFAYTQQEKSSSSEGHIAFRTLQRAIFPFSSPRAPLTRQAPARPAVNSDEPCVELGRVVRVFWGLMARKARKN